MVMYYVMYCSPLTSNFNFYANYIFVVIVVIMVFIYCSSSNLF
jgi:hypothetical protein